MKYIDTVSDKLKEYYSILSPEWPDWLDEYIYTSKLQQQAYVSCTCGKKYAKMFNFIGEYSSLEHSVAVALIIWNFTKDKKQTLSGLFHDIATPAFKHCVDFLNGDYMNQESTEDLTTYFIKNSEDIMALLNRDGIKLEEVCDYHMYPIADNDTPFLSSDRLEYSMSNGAILYGGCTLEDVREMYNDIEVQHDENGVIELGFKTQAIAEKFVEITSKLSIQYRDDETRYYMQFVADLFKRLSNVLSKQDLYILKEYEVVDKIKESEYADIWNLVADAEKILTSLEEPTDYYFVHHGAKIRYIDPLVNGERISKISEKANKDINDNLAYDMESKYLYLKFNFPTKPTV